jgi:hypothetical protein
MNTTPHESRANVARLGSAFVVVIGALLLGACTVESSEARAPAELPTPGTIQVVEPLKLAARARVPEKEPGFVSAEASAHQLFIVHDGSLAPFTAGDVLGGTEGGGYLVRVASARALDATHVALETTPASLTQFITEGEFHVHYDAEAYARDIDRSLVERRDLGEEDGARIASEAEALKISSGAPIRLLDLSHESLPASCGVLVDGAADLDVTAELSPVIDLDVKIGPRGFPNPVPQLLQFRLVASGRLDVNAKLRGTGTVTGNCSIDLLALAGGVPSVPLPTLTFWVGPVPVIVTTEVVPRAAAEVELSFAAADVTAEAQTTAELEAGVDYENKTWSTIWDPSCEATGTASIGAPGPITASCEVSAGAELRARLYGLVGPSIGVQAYARASAETAPPYCTYDAQIDGGVRAYAKAEAGVSVGPLDLTLASLDLVDLELLHFDGPHTSGKLRDAPECSADW